jgi:hypothetical protein
MKKIIILLNEYLSNFWFILLLIVTGWLVMSFFEPISIVVALGNSVSLDKISAILWRFWVLYLLSLAVISIFISTIVWLKDKADNNFRGFIALIIILFSLSSSFFFSNKVV